MPTAVSSLPLNEAYIQLLEFAYDREARLNDRKFDADKRARLQFCLDEIVRLCDRIAPSNQKARAG